jgi:hypothetical protein
MDTRQKTRREYLTVGAIDPISGKEFNVLMSYERIKEMGSRSYGQVLECGELVPIVLKKPFAIFEGLTLDADDSKRGCGWRCYCAVPPHAYTTNGKLVSTWPNEVFLVFVNDENVVYNWRWEKCDSESPNLPENYEIRFRKRLL